MYDVARRAGVSQTAVSFVLNGRPDSRIPEATRDRVWEAIRELGYRPNAVAQGLRLGGTQMIGFVTDAIATTPFAGAIIRGAQDAAWAEGNLLLIVNTDGNPDTEEEAIRTMLEHRVRGIVYSTWYHRAVAPPASILEAPAILANCFVPDKSLPSVVPDELQGGRSATQVLIRAGHRRIAMLNSVPQSREASIGTTAAAAGAPGRLSGATSAMGVPAPATVLRVRGYHDALSANGIPVDPRLLVEVEPVQEGGYEGAAAVLDLPPESRPTAIFAYNDRVAMGAYAAAADRGLSIPRDLSIIGFDNQEIIAAHLRPPLSTFALPHYEIGWASVSHLLSPAGRRRKVEAMQQTIACPYVERSSI